jgi:hypothetical protein
VADDKRDAVPAVPPTLVSGSAAIPSAAIPGLASERPGAPPAMPAGSTIAASPTAASLGVPPAMPVLPTLVGGPSGAATGAPPAMPVLATLVAGPNTATGAPPAMPAAHSPLALPGTRYVLGAEIARGGMGRVVEATDTVLARSVAVKEALAHDRDTLGRFDRETRITAQLEHPSIVPVYDAGESPGGGRYYVMRKVSGRPLEQLVASAETLNDRLALIPHIVDSAQAIAHAHARRIVHRDIKPANILVGELGETVVIDWGLAKVIGEPEEASATTAGHDATDGASPRRPQVDLDDALKTRAGIVYGTPGFMAPEQLRGAPVDEGCDVYALGATLYHLLSRRPPHHAKTAEEMMKAAVAAPPTPIRDEVAGVPHELADIVDKALAHDPKVRYPNARALAEDLQRFLTGRLVAAHHYSPRERIARFIRKNRGVSAAVAALIVVGALAITRIVVERNRADAAAQTAIAERAEAVRRAELLTLAHARDNADVNPTKAVAMLKPLAERYWRDVRAIAAAARANGVAWGLAASNQTLSLELSGDGTRAVSAGDDGVIRIHDLVHRTDRTLAELHVPAMARFADAERQVLVWHDQVLAMFDVATGRARELAVAAPIADLEVIATTAYWIDAEHEMWKLELTGGPPGAMVLDEPVVGLSPSPDGRWLALTGERHLFLYDRTQPAQAAQEMVLGHTRSLGWAADSLHFAALIDGTVIEFAMTPEPAVAQRMTLADRQFVAYSGTRMYAAGASDVVVMERIEGDMVRPDREPLRGGAVGMAVARGGSVVAAATDGVTILTSDGYQVLPLQAARVESVVASPSSPYVIAVLEHRLLVWNLDEIQPRHIADRPPEATPSPPPDPPAFAGSDQVIVAGHDEGPAQAIELASPTRPAPTYPLGDWPGLADVAAVDGSPTVAIRDRDGHVHLATWPTAGQAPRIDELPGAFEFAGFATAHQLVLATRAGAISVHDLATGQRRPLVTGPAPLLGLAWGRGRHPWVAAAFADGSLWRKNLATGLEATAARIPRIDPGHLARADGKLVIRRDGTVMFCHDREVDAWTPDGALVRQATLPGPVADLGEAGPDHVLAFTTDAAIYAIAASPGAPDDQTATELGHIEASAAAMSPETGLLVALEHGALVVVDPVVRQRFPLALAHHAVFDSPAISQRGDRVLARSRTGVLVWSLDLPTSPGDTARWLDAMTNAIDDQRQGLGWR